MKEGYADFLPPLDNIHWSCLQMKYPAEDLSWLRPFEVTELDESRSVRWWSFHVNTRQDSVKNLTVLQSFLPIESCLLFFSQIEDTSDIKLTNLLNNLAVTLNLWSLHPDNLLHLKLFKQRYPVLQKLHSI